MSALLKNRPSRNAPNTSRRTIAPQQDAQLQGWAELITPQEEAAMRVEIVRDECPDSPDTWADYRLFVVGVHRKFFVRPPFWSKFEKWDHYEMVGLCEELRDRYHIFQLEAHINGGIVLALAGDDKLNDSKFDVVLAGAVFCSKDERKKKSGPNSAESVAKSLINAWNMYLCGDVWCVSLYNDNGDLVDSVCGVYGRDYAQSEAAAMLAYEDQRTKEA